ncbi:MAG: heavy-metal-associated domain-containing protein [Flavobacteriales bacterium]|nr:heavy-metal-associated domain-containing protein [Flavobacteriales bacterium]
MFCFSGKARQLNTEVSDTFRVYGNCGMCEKKIEAAATSVKGVKSADWDRESNVLILMFDEHLTNSLDVQKAIAKAGYDTEMVKGDDKAYDKLPGCCKYERKE